MFYSKLYKKCYPFRSGTDILSLNPDEKSRLIHCIKHYPGRISEKLLNAKKYGLDVEGWDRPKGLKSRVFPSTGLAEVLVEPQENCNDLISRIETTQPLTDGDIANINRVLYANKYCWPLSWFLVPTPDGRVSAVME